MDADGAWLDVGCANGYLMATLPAWAAESGVTIDPHGLELIPSLANLARASHPELADRIWTGSVMTWQPPRRFRYVTALEDAVPPQDLSLLVNRVLGELVAPEGRLILSSYTNREDQPRSLVDELFREGLTPSGVIHIDRPAGHPLMTVWFDNH
jgi:protein-L-isoaspartate O-methyltransferase